MYHLIVNGYNVNAKTEAKLDTVKEVFKIAGKEITVHKTDHAGHKSEAKGS